MERVTLSKEQQELAAAFLPLARCIAKPYKLNFPRYHEEFESAAMLALTEAARNYDAGRNTKFATYARFRIRGRCKDVLKNLHWDDHIPNIGHLKHPDTVTQWPNNYTESPTDPFDCIDTVDCILTKYFHGDEREIFKLYFMYGKTSGEIAKHFNLCQSEITRRMKSGMDHLRHYAAYNPLFEEYSNVREDESTSCSSTGRKKRLRNRSSTRANRTKVDCRIAS